MSLCEKINEVNALGRQNLTDKGISVPDTATTYEIMQSIADIVIGGGGSGISYTNIVYNDDNTITLTDTDGAEHTMVCEYTDGKITSVEFDGISIPLQYNESNLVKVGGVSVDVSNAPVSSGGGTEAIEQIIDESGVLEDTEGTVTEKVEQLIDLAEKGKNDTLKARLTNTLTEYTIMDAITLTTHCFSGCSNLVKFSAPNLVKSGNNSVFYGCASLEYVDFGKITTLSISDVNGCHRITAIILRNTETVVSLLSPFTNNNSITREDYKQGDKNYYCYFYVPKALLEDYKVATNWSNYANRFRAIEDYPEITGGVI